MKKILIFLLLLVLIGCNNKDAMKKVKILSNKKGYFLTVHIEPGKNWVHKFKLFSFIKINNRPQIAIWIEDEKGNYLNTIFVTQRTAKQNWKKSLFQKEKVIRRESLPVWENRVGVNYINEKYIKSKYNEEIEGVAGATPKSNFEKNSFLNLDNKKIIVYLEVNHSNDFNELYSDKDIKGSKNNSLESGQPSLIYKLNIDLEKINHNKKYEMKLVGSGNPIGKDGEIYSLEGITTAKKIIKKITINIDLKK